MLGRVIETGPNRIVMKSGLFPFLAPALNEESLKNIFPFSTCRVVEVEVPSTHEVLMAEALPHQIAEWVHNTAILGANAPIMFHYMHSDPKNPQQVRFIANAADAERLRWTSMLPGRYLNKFFPHLDSEVVKEMATSYMAARAPAEFCLATTQDDIIDVYRKGPTSCMSHPLTNYETHIHPVAAYASPDVAIAYIRRGDRIIARSVTNMKTKQYTRIYGDAIRFEMAAKEHGFSANGTLAGCRLPVIHNERDGKPGYIVPYIDGGCGLVLDEPDEAGNQWLHVEPQHSKEWHMSPSSTSGRIHYHDRRVPCQRCNERGTIQNMISVVCASGTQLWCASCTSSSLRVFFCHGSNTYYSAEDFKQISFNGVSYSRSYDGLAHCSVTGEWLLKRNGQQAVSTFSDDFSSIVISTFSMRVKVFRRFHGDQVYFVPEYLLARWDALKCQPQLSFNPSLEPQIGAPTS